MSRLFFLFVFLILVCGHSLAQGTASISGTVTITDSSVLHGATVHILQLNRSVQTDDSGVYRFGDVPPGRYTVLVHLEGFGDASKTVDVAAGVAVNADFQLALASIKEQVTVTASGTEQSVFDSFQTVNSVGSTRIAERGGNISR